MAEAKDVALKITGLYKDFLLPHDQKNSIKEKLLHPGRSTAEHLHALRDINLEVKRGEFFGIVGRNGSGKSTLLKIIGGIYVPTKGSVQVNGTLTPFIELGIGFSPNLTGRENVFLNGAILGLSRKEVNRLYPQIVAFAELERFMDQKLKNYSSGMQVRLAFSIAMQAHNDILLIDEVLAVGDANFQRKCFQVFNDIKKEGTKTVIFVTHDMGAVQKFCDRAMMIQDSEVLEIGEPRKIALRYELANSSGPGSTGGATLERPKDPAIEILDFRLLSNGKKTDRFDLEDEIVGEVKIKVHRSKEVQLNLYLIRSDGTHLAGINTIKDIKDYSPSPGIHTLHCTLKAGQLVKGDYRVGLAIYSMDTVPELIDIIDKEYTSVAPMLTIVENSEYQDGQFYITGKWSKDPAPKG